jgi:hypothetical protein
MQTDAPQTGIRDCRAAEGQVEAGQVWATKGEDLRCGV